MALERSRSTENWQGSRGLSTSLCKQYDIAGEETILLKLPVSWAGNSMNAASVVITHGRLGFEVTQSPSVTHAPVVTPATLWFI